MWRSTCDSKCSFKDCRNSSSIFCKIAQSRTRFSAITSGQKIVLFLVHSIKMSQTRGDAESFLSASSTRTSPAVSRLVTVDRRNHTFAESPIGSDKWHGRFLVGASFVRGRGVRNARVSVAVLVAHTCWTRVCFTT